MERTALVTGAGSGIGRACALALVREGWRVALAGRRTEALDGTVRQAGEVGSRLLAIQKEEEEKAGREARLNQIGTGDRSEKIRTYNFPQDRVTDHRIGRTQHGLPGFMIGNIGDMLDALRAEDLRLKLEQAAA